MKMCVYILLKQIIPELDTIANRTNYQIVLEQLCNMKSEPRYYYLLGMIWLLEGLSACLIGIWLFPIHPVLCIIGLYINYKIWSIVIKNAKFFIWSKKYRQSIRNEIENN